MAGTFADAGVSYVIAAEDVSKAAVESAVAGTQKVKNATDRMAEHTKNCITRMRKHWLGITAAIAAAALAARKGWQMMEEAADYQERINSLNALGAQYGLTGDQIVRSMKEASRGILSLAEAADMAASSMNLALTPQQMIEFTHVAETLTDVIGGSIPDAYNRMVVAAASGRLTTLAQMGIIVDLQAAYAEKAAAMNRDVKSLSEAEKQQIRLNVILDAAKDKIANLGPTVDTTRDKMDRFAAKVRDAELFLGQGLIRATMLAHGSFQWLASGAMTAAYAIMKLMELKKRAEIKTSLFIGERGEATKAALLAEAEALAADAEAMREGAINLSGQAAENIQAALVAAEKLAQVMSTAAGAVPAPTADDEVKRREDIAALLTGINRRVLLDGMANDAKALAQMSFRHAEEIKKLEALGAEKAQIDAAGAAHKTERDALIQAQGLEKEQALAAAMEGIRQRTAQATATADEQALLQMDWRHAEEIRKLEEYGASRAQLDTALNQQEIERKALVTRQKMELDAIEAKAKAKGYQDMLRNASYFFQAMGEQSLVAFRAYQAIEIGQTLMATYAAAQDAFSWGMKYGGPAAPALATAAAAAAVAAGLARVQQIASMMPDTGTGAVGTYSASYSTGLPAYDSGISDADDYEPEAETAAERPLVVNVYNYGYMGDRDGIARDLAPAIRKAFKDRF